jgi:L-aspartate oxidase
MNGYHPDGDLAPRDVVARSIVREAERTGHSIFLSLAHLDASRIRDRFPTIAQVCRQVGLDLARDPIPVGPAAHYLMGGIDTDEWGRTSVPALFAAGEAACTGVHGANRLASNSLLEGLVFGARVAVAMTQPAQAAPLKSNRRELGELAIRTDGPVSPSRNPAGPEVAVRDLMWKFAGLFRSRAGLAEAVRSLDDAYLHHRRRGQRSVSDWQRFNLVTVARLIARAALRREESRGGHFREDFPSRDDINWKFHAVEENLEPSAKQ